MEHVALDALNAGVAEISRSPSDVGRIELIVRRPGPGKREVLAEGVLDSAEGMIGDRWSVEAGRDPDAQLTLMNIRAAALFAGSLERCPLAGDQLFVDLDLSLENIPPASRLMVGAAVIEVTALPHRGCGKFVARFGLDAAKFVNSSVGRRLNVRGVNARVIAGGLVRTGDRIVKQPARDR